LLAILAHNSPLRPVHAIRRLWLCSRTLLHRVAAKGKYEFVRLLVANGADAAALDENGCGFRQFLLAHRRRTHVTAGQSKWAVESSCTRLSRKLDYRNKGTGTDNRNESTDNRNERTRPLFRKTPRDFAGIEVRHFDSDENFPDALAAFDAALEVRRLSSIVRCQQ
jgi:hypothetical protein